MARFVDRELETHDVWRAIILYGQNVATYKFALAKALLEFSRSGAETVSLDQLAEPYARNICEHLEQADKQITSRSSSFLNACRAYNRGDIERDELLAITTQRGFANVIDAFHVVNREDVPTRFFVDERASNTKGIRITDHLLNLQAHPQFTSLPSEVESRWRLVESAWTLQMPRAALTVDHEAETGLLIPNARLWRRQPITRARDALNGYQQGVCFYCNATISLAANDEALPDVDHFFPHTLKPTGVGHPIDGVWNLVLACQSCNRGARGKFTRLPTLAYLEKLNARNTYLIDSHHPLRETLRMQTGRSQRERERFLQQTYGAAKALLVHTWTPAELAGGHVL